MQTELHRHLDVSIRTETLLSLAQERGLEAQSTSLEQFKKKIVLRQPLSDLRSVLALFSLFQKVLDRPEVLERVAFEGVEDCWNEGTRNIELRYSPSFVSEYSMLSWDDSLTAFHAGIERAKAKYPQMRAGLICIATRDFGTESVDQTVEFFLKHPQRLIGLDLAGNETQFPCRLFENSFKKAVQQSAKITVHAGEAAGPENIWEAIELLGAHRIGHGVASIQDPLLLEYLIKNQVCLEMCPTSNWLTNAVSGFAEHPLPLLLRKGIPVSINTDDPGVFGVTLADEMEICRTQLGMSAEEIKKCNDFAYKATFLATH
jgi:adenosine deaminase